MSAHAPCPCRVSSSPGSEANGRVDGGRSSTHQFTETLAGTMGYMDPEYMRTGQLSLGSDCYSFGVLLLQMLTGRAPHDRSHSVSLQVSTRVANHGFQLAARRRPMRR